MLAEPERGPHPGPGHPVRFETAHGAERQLVEQGYRVRGMPSFNALDDVLSRVGLARQSRRRERPLPALQVLGDGQHRAELSI